MYSHYEQYFEFDQRLAVMTRAELAGCVIYIKETSGRIPLFQYCLQYLWTIEMPLLDRQSLRAELTFAFSRTEYILWRDFLL